MIGEQVGPDDLIAAVDCGYKFPCPRGVTLTALEGLMIALPGAIVEPMAPLGSAFETSAEVEMRIEFVEQTNTAKHFLFRLVPGAWIQILKPCEVMILSEDRKPRRLRITKPH